MMLLFQAITPILILKMVGCETVSIQETIVRKLVKPEDISYKDDSVSVISYWHYVNSFDKLRI